MAGISATTPAPQLNQILNKADRKAAGIDSGYIDLYNDSQLAKYNNEYNYWLWQQQTEYNSPANQVARLKEAGLNPNYNSIDGAGNATQMPSSNANYRSDIVNKELAQTQTGIQAFNAILSAISQGVNSYQKIQQTPVDTRNYLKLIQQEGVKGATLKNFQDSINAVVDLRDKLGIDIDNQYMLSPPDSIGKILAQPGTDWKSNVIPDSSHSVDYNQKELRNDAMILSNKMKQYEAGTMQPLEAEKLREQIHQLGIKMNLDEKQLHYFDYMMGIKGGALLMSLIGKIL